MGLLTTTTILCVALAHLPAAAVNAQNFYFNYDVHPRRHVSPVVDVGYAKYRGVSLPDEGVDQYLGMRFAQAPVGDLRFRAPREPVQEDGVVDASELGPLCIGAALSPTDGSWSEDCLTVNVFAPSNATSASKLPVWLFVQGGGYAVIGQFFNGTEVVRMSGGNIVFVDFNYRVGALGFLAGEKVREDGDLNAGLLDQRMILEWVQKHISKFGGDPAHVTLHGLSAGAGSVAHHLTAYDGEDRGLFAGAIAQSTFWPTQRTVAQSEVQFTRFVNMTGCSGAATTSAMACLRNASLATIQQANVNLPFPEDTSGGGTPFFYWLPVTTGPGSLVPGLMSEAFAEGRFVRVPLVVGDDNDEGTVFVPNATSAAQVGNFLVDNYPLLTPADVAEINAAYPPSAFPALETRAEYFPALAAAYGEATFTCAGNSIAQAMSAGGGNESSKVWNYRVNVQDPDNAAIGWGVPHVFENVAIWGPGNTGDYRPSWNTTNAAVIPVIMDYYISFVRALDPSVWRAVGAPVWETWSGGKRLRLQTNSTAMEEVPSAQVERCRVWEGLRNVTQQ